MKLFFAALLFTSAVFIQRSSAKAISNPPTDDSDISDPKSQGPALGVPSPLDSKNPKQQNLVDPVSPNSDPSTSTSVTPNKSDISTQTGKSGKVDKSTQTDKPDISGQDDGSDQEKKGAQTKKSTQTKESKQDDQQSNNNQNTKKDKTVEQARKAKQLEKSKSTQKSEEAHKIRKHKTHKKSHSHKKTEGNKKSKKCQKSEEDKKAENDAKTKQQEDLIALNQGVKPQHGFDLTNSETQKRFSAAGYVAESGLQKNVPERQGVKQDKNNLVSNDATLLSGAVPVGGPILP